MFARLLGDREQIRLFAQTLNISRETAAALAEPNTGLYFDWGPDSSRYLPYVERLLSPDPEDFLKVLHGLVAEKGRRNKRTHFGHGRAGSFSRASTRFETGLRVNISGAVEPANADFLLALPGLRDIVGGLHPHECVHLHAESLLDA